MSLRQVQSSVWFGRPHGRARKRSHSAHLLRQPSGGHNYVKSDSNGSRDNYEQNGIASTVIPRNDDPPLQTDAALRQPTIHDNHSALSLSEYTGFNTPHIGESCLRDEHARPTGEPDTNHLNLESLSSLLRTVRPHTVDFPSMRRKFCRSDDAELHLEEEGDASEEELGLDNGIVETSSNVPGEPQPFDAETLLRLLYRQDAGNEDGSRCSTYGDVGLLHNYVRLFVEPDEGGRFVQAGSSDDYNWMIDSLRADRPEYIVRNTVVLWTDAMDDYSDSVGGVTSKITFLVCINPLEHLDLSENIALEWVTIFEAQGMVHEFYYDGMARVVGSVEEVRGNTGLLCLFV